MSDWIVVQDAVTAHSIPLIFITIDVIYTKLCFTILNLVGAVVLKVGLYRIFILLKISTTPSYGWQHYYIELACVTLVAFLFLILGKYYYCLWKDKANKKNGRTTMSTEKRSVDSDKNSIDYDGSDLDDHNNLNDSQFKDNIKKEKHNSKISFKDLLRGNLTMDSPSKDVSGVYSPILKESIPRVSIKDIQKQRSGYAIL